MAIMNLLKSAWVGKLGETVGAKWKNKNTIRAYTKPAYTNTPAQQEIRQGFGAITSYVALFADQIKPLSALDTKGMSVRNAIIKLNKAMITTGTLVPAQLQISRGGLPTINGFAATVPAGLNSINTTWTAATGATISAKARVVVVAVNDAENFTAVGSALNSAGTLVLSTTVPPSVPLNIHYYLIDYRGSSKVGSASGYITVTSPASR